VAPVATAIPAFIGYTEKAENTVADDLLDTPTRLTSLLDYETYFGTAQDESDINVVVSSDDKIVVTNTTPSKYLMYYSLQMYFANGGGPCYVTSVGTYGKALPDAITLAKLETGLAAVRKEDEPTLLLFPDATSLSVPADFYAINNSALTQCNELQDRFTIMDTFTDASSSIDELRDGINLGKDYLKYGAAYYPFLSTILDYAYNETDVSVENASSNSSKENATNLLESIVAGDLGALLETLAVTRDLIAGGGTSVSSSNLENVRSQSQAVLNYTENLKSTFDSIIEIAKEDGQSTTALEAWIVANLDDKISSMTSIQSTINSSTSRSTIINNLQVNTTNVFGTYGAASPETTPLLAAQFLFDADVTAVTTTPGDAFALVGAITTGSNFTTLEALETSDNVLFNRIKSAIGAVPIDLPPSSAMAGIYARVDNNVGVWKAPANVGVSYVVKPTVQISQEEQGDMNVTSSGKSVNAIRTFTGKGTLVWGARTLAGNDNEWRYVPVRRFFSFVEESVSEASEQFVFEPNDGNTWVRIRGMIENFLTQQWKAGALAGAKPSQAFYVRVGLGSTMTAQDILEGRMIIEIGMAAVRPAEFIVLRFSHKMQEA
jgi:phage tail sheath protein FI